MHDKPRGGVEDDHAATAALDVLDQRVVLVQALAIHPTPLRVFELVREVCAGSADFDEGDRYERAVRDLVGVGLLFLSGELVLPTRAALRFDEIVREGV